MLALKINLILFGGLQFYLSFLLRAQLFTGIRLNGWGLVIGGNLFISGMEMILMMLG